MKFQQQTVKPMSNIKSYRLVRKVARMMIATTVLIGMAAPKLVSASEITAEGIKAAARKALSKMKPIQIRTQGDAIPFEILADEKGAMIEDSFSFHLCSQPPLLNDNIGNRALYLANGIAEIESYIVETLPYIEARVSLLKPKPKMDSSRSLTKGEFETQRQFEERVSLDQAKALNTWNAREKDVSSILAKHSGSWRVLIPGLNREVETIPVVFHSVPNPAPLEQLRRLFGIKEPIEKWRLPLFDPETLKYQKASFLADLQPNSSDFQLDLVGLESLDITAKKVAHAQELKQAIEQGSVLMSAQALPILAGGSGGNSRGHTSYRFLVLLFDIRFLDGANDGLPYEGISVTLGEPKLDAETSQGYAFPVGCYGGYSLPSGHFKKDRDAFYSKLSEWLGQSTLHY